MVRLANYAAQNTFAPVTEDGMNGIGTCRNSAGKRYDLKMQLQF